jgi:hypothetical protein
MKSGFTIVEKSIVLVPDFEKVVHKPDEQVTLRGQSNSTLQNYIRRIALFVLRFGILPGYIDLDEINEQNELSLFYKTVQQTYKIKWVIQVQFVAEEKHNIKTVIKRKQPPKTNLERFARLTGVNPCLCRVCKTGRIVTIRELTLIQSPA